MAVATIFVLIGVVLIFVSAFVPTLGTASLWNLGWGFVLTGALLIGKM